MKFNKQQIPHNIWICQVINFAVLESDMMILRQPLNFINYQFGGSIHNAPTFHGIAASTARSTIQISNWEASSCTGISSCLLSRVINSIIKAKWAVIETPNCLVSEDQKTSPVTMHSFGGRVHAPMNCTTFLCRIFLQTVICIN